MPLHLDCGPPMQAIAGWVPVNQQQPSFLASPMFGVDSTAEQLHPGKRWLATHATQATQNSWEAAKPAAPLAVYSTGCWGLEGLLFAIPVESGRVYTLTYVGRWQGWRLGMTLAVRMCSRVAGFVMLRGLAVCCMMLQDAAEGCLTLHVALR